LNTIEELKQIIPVPKSPIETSLQRGWDSAEIMLKTKLPIDYKEFIDTYGSGYIGNFLYLWNPFSKKRYMNLILRVDEFFSLATSDFEATLPFPLYPKPNGILPFANTVNGDTIFWITAGNPDEWTIFVLEARSTNHFIATQTLAGFLNKTLVEKIGNVVFSSERFNFDQLFSQSI
jgi:hypothetical protein